MKSKYLAAFVEPSMHEALRLRAFRERCSVGEIVRKALAMYLERKAKGR